MDNLIGMYWLDLAIIYLAFGAPFGVFQITARRELTLPAFFQIASGYILWPLTAIQSTARFLFTKPAAQKVNLDSIRTEIEKALFADAAPRDLYAFREVFYRYTGLAAAISDFSSNATFRMRDAKPDRFHSSFIIHNSSLVRSACISRRDYQKLNSQLATARQDLVDMMVMREISKIDDSVLTLADHFYDKALLDGVYSR